MKIKAIVIILTFAVCVHGAQPALKESSTTVPAQQAADVDLFEGNKSVKQLEKEAQSFMKFKSWVIKKKQAAQEEYLQVIRKAILQAYAIAQDLDPYAMSENEIYLLRVVVDNIALAQKIAQENITQSYWETSDGKKFLASACLDLEAIDNLIAVFMTGALKEYPKEVSKRLDRTWKTIDFVLIPSKIEKRMETIYED
ncbi:MAG: hypothetical protein P4L31_03050 [Candidatus Babeliales bacterium]|nr:hypothetical protein [Candidatus Babeliales bacterium]